MNNIICLKHGTKFDADYVNKLYCGVRRNTTLPFTFHCFTEDNEGLNPNIKTHSLPDVDIDGWWYKLYLFSDEVDIEGRVLYIDLDTLITGNIDHYIALDKGFVVLRDLWAKQNNVGSALMSFNVGEHKHIWDTFIKDPTSAINGLRPHGDQRWIQKQQQQRVYWQDLFPKEVVSFKSECRNGVPTGVKIVCYHGKPSIEESINTTTRVQRFTIGPISWPKKYWYVNEEEKTTKGLTNEKNDISS